MNWILSLHSKICGIVFRCHLFIDHLCNHRAIFKVIGKSFLLFVDNFCNNIIILRLRMGCKWIFLPFESFRLVLISPLFPDMDGLGIDVARWWKQISAWWNRLSFVGKWDVFQQYFHHNRKLHRKNQNSERFEISNAFSSSPMNFLLIEFSASKLSFRQSRFNPSENLNEKQQKFLQSWV